MAKVPGFPREKPREAVPWYIAWKSMHQRIRGRLMAGKQIFLASMDSSFTDGLVTTVLGNTVFPFHTGFQCIIRKISNHPRAKPPRDTYTDLIESWIVFRAEGGVEHGWKVSRTTAQMEIQDILRDSNPWILGVVSRQTWNPVFI